MNRLAVENAEAVAQLREHVQSSEFLAHIIMQLQAIFAHEASATHARLTGLTPEPSPAFALRYAQMQTHAEAFTMCSELLQTLIEKEPT